ncbi:replication-associated recombination protein A [Rhodospirillales bacterium YIM 152171]|uniref:Replication-associated recombination protein A n=2 Tax=Marinimicrococcus flavescens TaxID=3031815 RepID=A0AAP3XR52_9PROT|nr:replication-associated recombination protein A [Marinimicrococcus flavescens]
MSKAAAPADGPLADRLRPRRLEDLVGQEQALRAEAPLGRMLARRRLGSLLLWGPPGCGKTTLARLLAGATGQPLLALSAVMSGVADVRKCFEEARRLRARGTQPILFIDEIHRFNRAQQDALLKEVEEGTVTLVGATTENPSFALNAALLSRCQVVVLERLSVEALERLLARAEEHLGHALPLDGEARRRLAELADGDGRYLLNMIESVADLPSEPVLDTAGLAEILQRRLPLYDKAEDAHYNLVSALHKSIRGSDPDATLYWLSRMLDGGEDPRYIARRLVRMASEDIGLADPAALGLCLSAARAYEQLGTPEGELALAQAAIYLALAPKSNAAYLAYKAARRSAREHGSLAPPMHIVNAPTGLMKGLGYGKGYLYDHDMPDRFSGQNYFPEEMARERYYQPTDQGREQRLAERLAQLERLRAEREEDH